MKQTEKKSGKQSPSLDVVDGTLIERQMARQWNVCAASSGMDQPAISRASTLCTKT